MGTGSLVGQIAKTAEVVIDVDHSGGVLVDGGYIESGKQVQVGDTGIGQGFQVRDTVDAVVCGCGECTVFATQCRIQGFIGGAEITNVGLIDNHVLWSQHGRR